MLLSPGHSPRHLSSPSPISGTPTPNPNPNPLNSSSLQLNPPKSKRDPVVLDEDAYVAAIEKIIERDFFPDIPKLRDRLDWLQAVRTGDPVLIRDAQLKIMERRRGSHPTSSSHGNVNTSTFRRSSITPFEFEPAPSVINDGNSEKQEGKVLEGDGVDELTLDQFFGRYTSEDNDSFNKIMEKVNRKRKERYGYLLEGEKKEELEDMKRDRITDGFGTSGQPTSTLEGWKYEAKNLLMYHPADRGEAKLTEEEMAQRLKGLTKEIDRYNTRFHGKMLDNDSRPKGEDEVEVLYTTVAGGTPVMAERDRDKTKKYDLEDLRKTPADNRFYVESEKKAENGYSFVKTPSPAPGVDESPFVTWGEIEGTPLRLDPEDTPFDIGGTPDQPCFKIPCPPSRDLKAHSLSREAARKIKERSKMFHRPPLPSPMRSGSASPSVRTLSPAAQKFMRNAMSKSTNSVDESLRASYRGNSPVVGTPSNSGRSISRLARDRSIGSRSPSVRDVSNVPW